jgi:hypothetical protein
MNINEPTVQKKWETEKQTKSLQVAGNRAGVGFNIFDKNFDLSFIINLVETYDLNRTLRVGLASPIVGAKNNYATEDTLRMIGKNLCEQIKVLEKHDILCELDCGFPLCMFEEEELGALITCTLGFQSTCGVIIDVGPDLTAYPCFPLSNLFNISIRDFNDANEISDHFEKHLAPMRRFGSMDKCLTCKYLKRGQCCGGCLARSLSQWHESGDKNLITKLNNIKEVI